jgi:hypothetical protein
MYFSSLQQNKKISTKNNLLAVFGHNVSTTNKDLKCCKEFPYIILKVILNKTNLFLIAVFLQINTCDAGLDGSSIRRKYFVFTFILFFMTPLPDHSARST